MMMMSTPQLMVLLGIINFFLGRKKILMILLSLEMIMLSIFLLFILNLIAWAMPATQSIYLLVMGACEASLGLSLMINMTRMKGNDTLKSTSMKFYLWNN